jgi:hypothetical protein
MHRIPYVIKHMSVFIGMQCDLLTAFANII